MPLVRVGDFAVLRTPALVEPLQSGTYQVTVRMKVRGMLHTLGSAVAIRAGGQTREVWMNEFFDEDDYQEFTLLFESRPGDAVTRRDADYTWRAPGGPGSIVERAALPGVFAALQRNTLPWEDRFAYCMAKRVAAPRLKLAPAAIPDCAAQIRQALDRIGPDGLSVDAAADAGGLTAEVVAEINRRGANRPDGSVLLFFPQNVTAVKPSRGPATPHPTLRTLVVDWVRVERLPEPDHLVLREVTGLYPWRRPGERQIFDLWLHNRSGTTQTQTLRLLLRSGLHHEETLWEQPQTLADGGYRRVPFAWDIPVAQPLWGQEIVAQVLQDGVAVSEERCWFALHRFSNAVMVHDIPNTRRFLHPYATHPPQTRNHRELFGATCTIYDSAGVVPDADIFDEPYAVGNGTYMMSMPTLAAITVANIRRFRTALRARHADFELRANADIAALRAPQDDPFDFERAYDIIRKEPDYMEFVSDHGSIMNEAWMSYGGFGTYANTCRNYLRAARFENAAYKMAGGHVGHMLWFYDGVSQYTPDEIYQQLFTFLAGSHLDGAFGPIPDSIHELGVYAIRFSAFFWDPALRPIRDLPNVVDSDSDAYLWLHETGFERATEDGGFLHILPIINPPVSDIWLENRFGLLPEPLRKPFGLTVRLPEGYSRVRGVYLLDNNPYPHVRTLPHTVARGEVAFDVPELVVFKVVVVEYEK